MQKALFISFFILNSLACHKKNEMTYLEWKPGDSAASLEKIESVRKTSPEIQVRYKNKNIYFSQQVKDQLPIEETFIKSVSSGSSSSSYDLIQTRFYSSVHTTSNFWPKKSVDYEKSLVQFEKEESLKIKNHTLRWVLRESKDQLKKTSVARIELEDGTLWDVFFDEKGQVDQKVRLGSQFFSAQGPTLEARLFVFEKGPKLSTISEQIVKDLFVSPTLSNSQVLVTSEANQKISEISNHLQFDPKDERFDQLQVFYYLNKVQTWMKDHLQVSLSNQLTAVVNIGYPQATNTAFYYQNKIRLGRGDDITYSALTSDPSIVYHESFHALVDGMSRLPYEGAGGSLNEAFADFFTCVALERPYLGEAAYLKGPYKRSLLVNYKLQDQNGGLYHDSQIISGLLWDLKEKIGREKTLNLAMETLIKLNPISDFSDFNHWLVTSIKENLKEKDLSIALETLESRGFKNE